MKYPATIISSLIILILSVVPTVHAESVEWKELSVSASAYNSVAWQTTAKKPALAAWGDVLKPGMRAIAVSRDLIKRGLTHGARVKIEGLPGEYIVRDKMNSRWRKKIDIYMGKDVQAAREWGIKDDIQITWIEPEGS